MDLKQFLHPEFTKSIQLDQMIDFIFHTKYLYYILGHICYFFMLNNRHIPAKKKKKEKKSCDTYTKAKHFHEIKSGHVFYKFSTYQKYLSTIYLLRCRGDSCWGWAMSSGCEVYSETSINKQGITTILHVRSVCLMQVHTVCDVNPVLLTNPKPKAWEF